MIDIPVIGKILGGAYKIGQHFKEKKEEEQMRAIADELRRRTHANAGLGDHPKPAIEGHFKTGQR